MTKEQPLAELRGAGLIDIFETARRLGRSVNAVRILRRRGKLRSVPQPDGRIMFHPFEVDRFQLGERDHTRLPLSRGNSIRFGGYPDDPAND